jgi:hypothetical protein
MLLASLVESPEGCAQRCGQMNRPKTSLLLRNLDVSHEGFDRSPWPR